MQSEKGADNHLVTLHLNYKVKKFAVSVNFKTTGKKVRNTSDYYGLKNMAYFISNIQGLYSRICETIYLQPHALEILRLEYPRGRLEFEGIADATRILRDLLITAPDYIGTIGNQHGNGLSTGNNAAQQEQSARQIEVLTPIIRDLAKMTDVKAKKRQRYIVNCLINILDPGTDLNRHIVVTK